MTTTTTPTDRDQPVGGRPAVHEETSMPPTDRDLDREVAVIRRAWGNRIREHRIARGWSQRAMGDALGAAQSTISEWEGGSSELPLATMQRLAEAFGTTIATMFGIVVASDSEVEG